MTQTENQTVQEFLTNWVINHLNDNWDSYNITEDTHGCYGYGWHGFTQKAKPPKKRFLQELKDDFGLIEWVVQDVMEHGGFGTRTNPYCIFKKEQEGNDTVPIFIYNFDGTYIKTYPTKTDKSYWDVWNWEFTDSEWSREFDASILKSNMLIDIQNLLNLHADEIPSEFITNLSAIVKKYS